MGRLRLLGDAGSGARQSKFTKLLGGLQFRDRDREPLHALAAEVDLHARVRSLPFGVDDHAAAELRVHDALADAETADFPAGGFLGKGTCACLEKLGAKALWRVKRGVSHFRSCCGTSSRKREARL